MFGRFVAWLGPGRIRVIFALLAITGLLSLMLNAVQPREAWVYTVQSVLALVFLFGAVLVVISRFTGQERVQVLILFGPALMALALGVFFPNLLIVTAVLAAGWVVIALLIGRAGVRREYQRAIRYLRKSQYDEALQVMNDLIKAEPKNADHYRFRAELHRLAGRSKRARADYEKVVALTPESGVGYNGLAEVYLQDGSYAAAREYGLKAFEREPNHWVASYNLGMIEDRLGLWAEAVMHLRQSLAAKIPDSRHRLLTHLWIARASMAQGKREEAAEALAAMKREQSGLREWKTIFESEQAAILRDVLTEDVQLAERLLNGDVTLDALVVKAR